MALAHDKHSRLLHCSLDLKPRAGGRGARRSSGITRLNASQRHPRLLRDSRSLLGLTLSFTDLELNYLPALYNCDLTG